MELALLAARGEDSSRETVQQRPSGGSELVSFKVQPGNQEGLMQLLQAEVGREQDRQPDTMKF